MNECVVINCNEKATRKSMCQKHYRRMSVYGDSSITNRRSNGDGKGYRSGLHNIIAESILGKALPKGAIVHHINHDPSDNNPSNLIICQSQAYHLLLHIRERALLKTGNANWIKCKLCNNYDSPDNITLTKKGIKYHPKCNRAHVKKYMLARKDFENGICV
jgi:hypothetical protein